MAVIPAGEHYGKFRWCLAGLKATTVIGWLSGPAAARLPGSPAAGGHGIRLAGEPIPPQNDAGPVEPAARGKAP
jgi:hypothetical protein